MENEEKRKNENKLTEKCATSCCGVQVMAETMAECCEKNDVQNIIAGKESPKSKFIAYVLLILSYFFGGISLLTWIVFLFLGSLNLVNLRLSESAKLGLNVLLCLAFFIQHSGMIRKSFRKWLGKFINADYHGAVYTIFSGFALLILTVFWQRSAYILAAPEGTLHWLVYGVFFTSIVGFSWGNWSLGSFDMFGVDPIKHYLRDTAPPAPMPFTIRGPYRLVRHPLYFFCLLMIWACPNLTADRLLYNVLWTIWIIIGTKFEERDLLASFGEEYHDYQRKVPMLIPYKFRLAKQ